MTPGPDHMTVPDDDPFSTTLISQLANRFFSESRENTSIPASLPGIESTDAMLHLAMGSVPRDTRDRKAGWTRHGPPS